MSKLKSAYKILTDFNLIIEIHEGVLNAGAYVKFKESLIKDPLFKANMNYFLNFKKVHFEIEAAHISRFASYIESNASLFGKRNVAIITNTPSQVVSATMYKLMQKDPSIKLEIFSTDEKALSWLKIPNSNNTEIKEIIETLSDSITK
ncbi:hypothetical protein EC396_11685 [Lutibacter sp. HS1-25]|uniref:hypothetical protein n=1 Tax=Lutibacter sp. HS1-25 TaxID=2485000 RepID=UPI0010110EF5|nr:hypothetical protein [Lutibacter sp. HS1-25]RXP52307.1 hypothetical protein EC396_11685 [Lutibacter sp. HS1-25]